MNNRAGLLTHFVDLDVRTGNREECLRFLITDLGTDDMILGYPWLTAFEPKFNWTNGVIDTNYAPVVIQSIDWKMLRIKPTIASILTEQEKIEIIEELNQECNIRSIATDLAREAQQYTKEVKIPDEYQ